jgi:hypothetical protein
MMKNMLSTAAALAFALGVGIPALHAQALEPVTHFGIAGGASVPTGDFNDSHNTGWNAMALLAFQTPMSPLGFRIDAGYAHLYGENPSAIRHSRIWSGTIDALLRAPNYSTVTPYAVGGIGIYNLKAFGGGSDVTVSLPDDQGAVTKFGWNLGGGLQFHTPGATIFTEARFTSILTSNGHTNLVPIEIGVMFP